MDTRTHAPPRTTPNGGTPPRTRQVGRAAFAALIVAFVLTAAVIVSVLYGTGRGTTSPPRPGVSPVQLERWGIDHDAVADFDHEHQSLRSDRDR
jgi:hypothetical protein